MLGVDLVLASVLVDALAAEALPVEQAHPNQRQPNVTGSLQVVAGKDAEAARVHREGLGEAEFQREVGDNHWRSGVPRRRLTVAIAGQSGTGSIQRLARFRSLQSTIDATYTQPRQEGDRVVAALLPESRIER